MLVGSTSSSAVPVAGTSGPVAQRDEGSDVDEQAEWDKQIEEDSKVLQLSGTLESPPAKVAKVASPPQS